MIEQYDDYALIELFLKAIQDKRKPCKSGGEIMKELTQWKRNRGLNGMRASWG